MNYQFSRKLYDTVLGNYSRHVKPRYSSVDQVNVTVTLCIKAVLDFDEKSGAFTFQGFFNLKWWDELIMWNKTTHGNIDMVQLSIHDVWVPKVVLGNSISYKSVYKFDNYFDSKMTYVTYDDHGSATITSSGIWETSCNADVSKFPFDVHACKIEIIAMEPLRDLLLIPPTSRVDIQDTEMHSEFKVQEASVADALNGDTIKWSTLEYTIKLARKPLFMMMNLVVPVYIISLANLLVFLLPLDSSDRVAFSVTMLLTFTVFMTMVTDKLPATDSLSHFNTFLLLQMVFSTLITICVLILHYVFAKKSQEPPKWVDWITTWKNKTNNSVESIEKKFNIEETEKWKKFARQLNKCLFWLFTIVILIEFAYFYRVTGS